MPIQSGDIKFLASKVMDDVPEGGGGPTGTIIPDGASNAMFEDVTEVDRAGGAAHIRQVHLAVQTPDTERLMDANLIVSRLPNDDNVSVTLAACSTFARRTEIANAIENYLIKGPEWGGYLLENHVAGQRSIQLLQRPGAATPPIGRTLALVYQEGLAGEVLQYVRITRVTTVDRTFSYQSSGSYVDYQATIVTCDLSDALRYAFPGSPPDRLYARAAGKTVVRDTTVADAATYYGAVPLAAPAALGDMSAKVLGIYSQLVPSSRTETAAIDQKPAAQRALVLATAPRRIEVGVTPHSLRIRVGQENRGFSWVQILKPLPAPGTIVVSYRALGNWYTLQDNGAGEFTGSGTGTVDYATGSLSITLPSMPDADSSIIINWGESTAYTSRGGSVGFRMPEFAWQLPHAPLKPGSVSISWMSGGVLRTVTDNGSGQLSGTGGAGEIAYATGHIFLRPVHMIDAGGEFATTYAYTNTITQSFEGVTPDAGGFATLALAETPAPRSLTARWITTRTVSASSGSTEVVTQGKTEAGVTARQSIISQTPGSRRMQSAAVAAWQAAAPVAVPALHLGWQSALRLRAVVLQHWQDAERLRAGALSRYQDMLRLRRGLRDAFQPARHLRASVSSREGRGAPLRIALGARYERAWVPRPGIYIPPEPPVRPPCYDPATLGRLVFEAPSDGTGRLVFVCERGGPGPQPPRFVIPVLEIYMSTHQLSAVLLPSLEPVALLDVTIDSDDGGMGWSLSASGPEHLLEQLAPVGGLPARIRVTLDGFDWVFAIERIGRTRRFGQHRCAIQGRSTTALLGEPYMPQQSWLGTSLQTAQQLVVGALEFTGTTLDWGIADWLVPAGAWSFTGTPLQAALRVADSVGAVVRSHRTDQQLVFAPRYPVLPWEWDAAVPDVQMPADIITTDGLDPDPRPAYNAVYVGGQAQGVLGHVRRAGTAGDLLAPQVTDALITDVAAARQRGIAVLGAAGNKLAHRMTLPFLTGGTNPGPVLPGYLIEVADIGHTWRGLVRGISISASMPVVRQTISVERNA